MSRTVCSWCKAPLVLKDDILVCSNTDCPACDEKYLHEELIRTRKELEQSEICCTEWEKQALDYKAENIALSGDLERTRKALEIAVDALKRANNTYCAEEEDITIDLTESAAHKWQRTAYQMEMPISIALEQITALEQKDK